MNMMDEVRGILCICDHCASAVDAAVDIFLQTLYTAQFSTDFHQILRYRRFASCHNDKDFSVVLWKKGKIHLNEPKSQNYLMSRRGFRIFSYRIVGI